MQTTHEGQVEVVVVRLKSVRDTDVVRRVFQEMTAELKQFPDALSSVMLCRSRLSENDWAFFLHHARSPGTGETVIGQKLAEALRSAGLVHRREWTPCLVHDAGS